MNVLKTINVTKIFWKQIFNNWNGKMNTKANILHIVLTKYVLKLKVKDFIS